MAYPFCEILYRQNYVIVCYHWFCYQIIEKRGPKVPIVVVGNKCELPNRFLPTEITEAIARYDWEHGYVECSAKENKNIVQVFKELLTQSKVNTEVHSRMTGVVAKLTVYLSLVVRIYLIRQT